MSQFQNEVFQFDFGKTLRCKLQASLLPWHIFIISFYVQIVTYSRKFYFVKINFNYLFSSYPYLNKSLWHPEFSHLNSNQNPLFFEWPPQSQIWGLKQLFTVIVFSDKLFKLTYHKSKAGQEI